MNGWIKLHRKTLENPIVMKDSSHLAIWCWLLMSACKFPTEVMFGGELITLKPGQITTGRRKIAKALSEQESKVYRVLKRFESEQLIEQRTDRQCTLISIVNWDKYQESEQGAEQFLNNDRTTSEQRVNTKKEYKNNKNNKKEREGARARARMREGTIPRGKLGNVFLTDDEYQDLKLKYENTDRRISEIGYYLANASREYNNHYALILKIASEDHWPRARRAEPEKKPEKILTPEEEAEREAAKEKAMEKIRKLHGKGAD